MSIRKDIIIRVYFTFVLLALVAIAIFSRALHVQVFQGDRWKRMSDSLTTHFIDVEAGRGNIYANDGSLLATSLPEYELRMDLMTDALTKEIFNENVDSLAICLANLFQDKTATEYEHKLIKARNNRERYLLIKRVVNYPQLQAVKKFPIFRLGKNKGGLLIIQKDKRIQPFNQLASRTIGYKVKGVQPVGLEGAYDIDLGGITGKRLVQRISGGILIPLNEEDEIAPKDGYDIYTTIDVNIQDVAQNALAEQLIKHNADHGCVILMEVATGEIKAIANLTRIEEGLYREKYNYAIGEAMEPGSTFKLATYMAALEDEIFRPSDTVDTDGGKFRLYNSTLSDSHEGGYGRIPMLKAFELSSNVAIAKKIHYGYKDKPEQFIKRLKQFGLDRQLELQIPGTPKPRLKDPNSSDWSGLSLSRLAIGYEIRMTPLQTLVLYNAVANGGRMISPVIVREKRSMGQVVETFKCKTIKKKICSDETLAMVRMMMEGVVSQGTAKNLSTTIYPIAGKTGTAQVAQGKAGYKNGKKTYQASFCGYFPANNPKYSMIVVVTDPSHAGYYGNVVAGPVFKNIADKVYASRLDMHQDISTIYANVQNDVPIAKDGIKDKTLKVYEKFGVNPSVQNDIDWVSINKNENKLAFNAKETQTGMVPSVTGMGLQDAIYLLENCGLKVNVTGAGKITQQSISAGQSIIKGSTIYLELK
jgi:cell division protein FtsI (penicillin-binding protein 3)